MSLPVVLGRDAEQEFDAAADYYQTAGLGVQFTEQVRNLLDRLSRTLELAAVVHRGVRCARVRRFPYNVFYRVATDRIEVIAILHGHRDPLTWISRT